MNREIAKMITLGTLMLVAMLSGAWQIQAQDTKTQDGKSPYPSMAPIEQYMMDRDAEIVMARSAAPEAISRDATILVLGRKGYEIAVEGKNGFVCAVERGWMGPFDAAEFWNPKIRGPLCFNPPAARSVLPLTYKRTEMVLAGKSKTEIIDALKAGYARKEFPALDPGGMSYMMSKQSYLTDGPTTDDGAHNMAHVMFYTTLVKPSDWGANLPKSPIYLNPQFNGQPEPICVFFTLTGMWSDGTAAPVM
jgi:hypothetical protein